MNVLESRMTPSPGPISTGSAPRPPTFSSWSTRLASTQQNCFKPLAPFFAPPNLHLTNSIKIPINNSAVNHNSEGRFPFPHAFGDLERAQVIIQALSILVVQGNLEMRAPVLLFP